jgi:excisionase family DNA binding protein
MSVATTGTRRWLTQQEAAEYLGCTDRTIRNFVKRGQIRGFRMGTRSVRLDRADLDNLLRPIPTAGYDA